MCVEKACGCREKICIIGTFRGHVNVEKGA
jgi:hypothetical protein